MDTNNDNDGNLIDTKHLKVSYTLVVWTIICVVVIGLLWGIASELFGAGEKSIGALLEKREYSAQYWVYLQPDGADAKNYRVKGDIERVSGDDSGQYMLDKVYWPNGGYTTFSDCDITSTAKGNAVENCTVDGEDISYGVRLGEKVK